jgi:peptidoglycan hydrolase-like protein with peptidoglycan-binding domain
MPQLQRRSRMPRVAIAVAALAGLAACVVGLVTLASGTKPATAVAPATNTAPIERRDLVVRDSEDGTLGYSGSRTVWSRVSGTVTWLPAAGQIIRRGQRLVSVDDRPVVLFYGAQPAYRRLAAGISDGADVRQLEENLVALGYDPGGAMAVDDHFSDTTAAIVKRWQRALGLRATGAVELGRVVFLPGERRVGQIKLALGSTGGGGGTGNSAATEIMDTTATRRVVTVKLDATKQAVAAVGAQVTITLPDGSATGGRITGVGKVAQKSSSGGGGGGGDGGQGTATIPVSIALTGQRRVTSLDQAPITVGFAKERRRRALSVPVTALVATAGGNYAVDVVHGARHRRVPVTPGIFASGYVEISGAGLAAGQRVVDAQ